MTVLRSLLFYALFLPGSAFFVLSAAAAAVISPRHVRYFPDTWARFHRWCLRTFVGIRVRETAVWMAEHDVRSIRLVTADWHMRRAALELDAILPEGTPVLRDAVRTEPSLWILFLEYHKLLATWFARAIPG
jgi:hypothetical protein